MKSYDVQVYKYQQQIKAYNNAVNALEVAKTLADKFDGKIINKRFITALNEASNKFFGKNIVIFSLYKDGYNYSHKQNIVEIELNYSDRDKDYEGRCIYIDYCRLRVTEISNNSECYINSDGRLNKEIFIKALDKQINNCKESISKYQQCIDHFDEYLDKIRDFNTKLDELRKEIPYPMRIYTNKLELPFRY